MFFATVLSQAYYIIITSMFYLCKVLHCDLWKAFWSFEKVEHIFEKPDNNVSSRRV